MQKLIQTSQGYTWRLKRRDKKCELKTYLAINKTNVLAITRKPLTGRPNLDNCAGLALRCPG